MGFGGLIGGRLFWREVRGVVMLMDGGLDLTICPLQCLEASLLRLKEVRGEIVVEC